ncbi:hypothetical protein K2X33_08300 [bacterium]|nr:hypothetical protein [bacterium]
MKNAVLTLGLAALMAVPVRADEPAPTQAPAVAEAAKPAVVAPPAKPGMTQRQLTKCGFAILFVGVAAFYAGGYFGMRSMGQKLTPIPPAEKLTFLGVDPNSSRFAVPSIEMPYAITSSGTVRDFSGATLPDSDDTIAIADLRQALFRADKYGHLYVYRPTYREWLKLESPGFVDLADTKTGVIGITQNGSVYLMQELTGKRLDVDDSGVSCDGNALKFVHQGDGFKNLVSYTEPKGSRASAVYALGKDALYFHESGLIEKYAAGSPEREELLEVELQIKQEEEAAAKQAAEAAAVPQASPEAPKTE